MDSWSLHDSLKHAHTLVSEHRESGYATKLQALKNGMQTTLQLQLLVHKSDEGHRINDERWGQGLFAPGCNQTCGNYILESGMSVTCRSTQRQLEPFGATDGACCEFGIINS